jgi:hypothetical protein
LIKKSYNLDSFLSTWLSKSIPNKIKSAQLMDIKEKLKKVRKKWWVIGVLVLIAPYLLGVTGIFAHGTWRYEVTVVVETPEGIKTGSAVRQVSNTAFIDFPSIPHGTNPANFKGEAVVVDLGERGFLFAVLNVSPHAEFMEAFYNPHGSSTVRGINYYNWNVDREKKTLDPLDFFNYPTFVTFKDIDDPKSVQLVYKTELVGGRDYKITDNTKEVLGDGLKIKEVSIQRTKKPLTWNINEVLTNDFWGKRREWNKSMSITERGKLNSFFRFRKAGTNDNKF